MSFGLLKSRPTVMGAALLTLAAIVMTRLPLVSDLGFEFAMVMTPLAACTTGFMAIALLRIARGHAER